MKTFEIIDLKKQFHHAIRDHESAVQEFLSSRSRKSSIRMSETYEKAAQLRQKLKKIHTKDRN